MSSSMRKIQTLFMLKLEMILKNLTIMLGPIMAILFVFIFKTVVEVPASVSQDEGMSESPVETLEKAIVLHLIWIGGIT